MDQIISTRLFLLQDKAGSGQAETRLTFNVF